MVRSILENIEITALASLLLVLVGIAQIIILRSQKRQTSIILLSQYRKLWSKNQKHWGNVIFIGRMEGEYYQVLSQKELLKRVEILQEYSNSFPTIWARDSVREVFSLLGEITSRILQGHMKVSDTYPIFGTEFLRQSRPMRQLVEPNYKSYFSNPPESKNHEGIRSEMQTWLSYHDGLRRRCLILIDLMWAEAVRMGDLPFDEAIQGALAKEKSGRNCRYRILKEVIRIGGIVKFSLGLKFYFFLKRAEVYTIFNMKGVRLPKYLR